MVCPLRIIPLLLISIITFSILVKTRFVNVAYIRLRWFLEDMFSNIFINKKKEKVEPDIEDSTNQEKNIEDLTNEEKNIEGSIKTNSTKSS